MLASLSFETPFGGLIAFAVAGPLAAAVVASLRARRGRKLLGLGSPPARGRFTLALVAAVPLLLALAATGPALTGHNQRRIRTDAQAMYIFDISRSMLASSGVHATDRLDEARNLAIRLRNGVIPEVPSGISTMTTIVLPHLFPTSNFASFDSNVRDAIAIESPPPPAVAVGFPGTSFASLMPLRTQGYFAPQAKKRIIIVITDGESGPYEPQAVGDAFVGKSSSFSQLPGQAQPTSEPRLSLFVFRVGGATDRIYHPDGSVEAAYRPDPRASDIVERLAEATHGYAFDASQLSAAKKEFHRVLGAGPTAADGTEPTSFPLGPYVALVAIAALAGVIWGRNLVSI